MCPQKVNGSHYKNAKSMPDVQLVYDKHFKQEVNFTFSSVHIPVEIYDGGLYQSCLERNLLYFVFQKYALFFVIQRGRRNSKGQEKCWCKG